MTTYQHPHVPESVLINGLAYRPVSLLRRTMVSLNVLYECTGQPGYVLKIGTFSSALTWLFWPLLVYMAWREQRIHRRIEGVPGIPAPGPRYGWRGYFHEYIPGQTLENWPRSQPLPEYFFARLATIVAALHELRVFYGDLDRKANIIVGDDGQPWLLDYQSCLAFRRPDHWWGRHTDRLFRRLQQEDEYHLLKHRRCYGDPLSPADLQMLERSRLSHWWRILILRPLRRLRRLFSARRTKTGLDRSMVDSAPSQRDPAH